MKEYLYRPQEEQDVTHHQNYMQSGGMEDEDVKKMHPGKESPKMVDTDRAVKMMVDGNGGAINEKREIVLNDFFNQQTAKPTVAKWNVKASGAPSSDNCSAAKKDFKGTLGPGAMFQGSDTRCGIELKATIKDFNPLYDYDLKRTIKFMRAKYLVAAEWHDEPQLSEDYTDDDTGDYKDWDECLNLSPVNPFLYSLDAPGFIAGFNSYPSNASEYVLFFDMEEYVRITNKKTNSSYIDENKQSWCAIVWMSKQNKEWKINKSKSYVGAGNMTLKLILNQMKK